MAIQQLTQPILNPIAAFDATKEHIISFIVIGGSQVVANRLTIQDNQTGNVVYSKIQSSLKLEHILPANTLQNGGYYNAIVETIDNANNMSSPSTPVPFYCYSSPVLTITNIPETETIGNGTYEFKGNYSQTEGELLNSYQFTLYNSNKEVLSQTPLIYYSTDSSLSYTFVGMSNDTSYYIELSGQTINNTKMTTGLLYFTVRYIQPASFAICDLVNDCANGYVQISSNIVAIDGRSNPDPPIYIDDKEVDLTDPDAWVNWNSGFRIQDDFTMGAWGRSFNNYQNIITLTNEINTAETPNRIELKWMLEDVVKERLHYTNAYYNFINLEDIKAGDVKNLEIYGNTDQFTTPTQYETASGNPVQFEDGKEGTSLKIQELDGESTQNVKDSYNILPTKNTTRTINGVVFTPQDDGSILVSGTATENAVYPINVNSTSNARTITLKANTNYRIYQNEDVGSSSYIVQAYFNKNNVTSYADNQIQTVEETVLGAYILVYAGVTLNNIIVYPQISEGIEEKPYEQYIVSPSPDYPSEIKNIGDEGTLNIEQNGKNKFNLAYIRNVPTVFTVTDTGVNLTNAWVADVYTFKNIIKTFKPSTTYTMRVKAKVVSRPSTILYHNDAIFYFYRQSTSTLGGVGVNVLLMFDKETVALDTEKEYITTFTTPADMTDVRFVSYTFYGNNDGYTTGSAQGEIDVSEIMLVEGTYTAENFPDFELYFNKTYILPLSEPLRSLPNGVKDTLEADGIHRFINHRIFDGSNDEKWYIGKISSDTAKTDIYIVLLDDNYNQGIGVSILSDYFENKVVWNTDTEGIYLQANNGALMVRINKDRLENPGITYSFKKWLSQNPITVQYQARTETIENYTDKQKEILNSMITKNGTNIIDSKAYMIVEYNYISRNFPSATNIMPIIGVGDAKNLIDISDFNITYTQKYYQDTKTNFILKPNYIYTLSYDFEIKSSSTDIYLSVGYGDNDYNSDITDTILYSTQTKGQNIITFTVPSDIPSGSYLWIRFARTIILADIDVDVSNIQLEKGESFTGYQSPNEYNIYPTVTKKNFYDYDNPLYIKCENSTYIKIDNGYNIKPKVANEDTYFAIGIKNILTEGNLYGISYSTLGKLNNVKLYRTNKDSQEIFDEIEMNDGIFTAPSSSYDLQLLFNLDSSSLLNYIEVWNIQLEADNVVSSYQLYNKNSSQITLDEPLRGNVKYEGYHDWMGIKSPNLLNPSTQSAFVEENTDYFYNKSRTYEEEITIQYKNSSGNIISSEVLSENASISTPENCVEIHIDGIDEQTIKTNHLQIVKGAYNKDYLPYITEPSVIRYIKKITLNGSTQIDDIGTNDDGYTWMTLSNSIAPDAAKGSTVKFPICNIALGTPDLRYKLYKSSLICQWTNNNASFCMALSTDTVGDSVSKVQEFFQKQYDNGTPVEIYYILAEPQVSPLSSTNVEALQSLVTYEPISNIFTNNDVLATLSLDYPDSITLQDTQNAYVLLKCWNGNKMPYVIHSNSIDVPEATDNIFIWLRRKKNIFDLRIENLTKGS